MTDQTTLKILIVDDDIHFRTLCKRRLQRNSSITFLVSEAADATSALETMDEETFDCLLIDHGLPDMAGTVLIEKLQRTLDLPVPMLLLSAKNRDDFDGDIGDCGAAVFLPKREVANYGLVPSILSCINAHHHTNPTPSETSVTSG